MRYIISGGGTGGHIFPAIAIADALQQQDPQAQILFVGAKGKMEMERVPKAGYPIEGLWIAGLQRQLSLKNILANLLLPFKLVASLWQAHRILQRFKPQVVIGVGGYASAAIVKMAQWKGIPTLIHEQNSHAGATNRSLAGKAKRICVAYPNMERFFPKERIVLTGNPIRQDIVKVQKADAQPFWQATGLDPQKPLILVIGGSLGARTLNDSIAAGLEQLKQADVQVYWQVGKLYREEFQTQAAAYANVRAVDFIEHINQAYAAASVIVSRAGALSIAELCQVGKPCILVPSPNVSDDHQTANAKALVEVGAAWLVKDAEARAELVKKALSLLQDQAAQDQMRQALAGLAIGDAAQRITQEIKQIVQS
jgi:UDP-N-acetylglucosamine--N-acetylmuramyl-(pentapeptide) pyrophosphoryl-undecaprenol N-acetylglucosamine transferase